MKVIDEETALEALEMVEQGQAVSYSDQYRYKGQVSDPDELMSLLMQGLRGDCFPIEVEPVKVKGVKAAKLREVVSVTDEESALRVLELVEQGKAVIYTDQLRVRMRIDDPDTLMACLKRSWAAGRGDIGGSKIEVEVE